MLPNKHIKVLIADDSIVFREVLSRGLAADPQIQVVATAGDPFDARDKILEFEPDVMTCDVEMPKMNGIEFIRRLIPQYPLPIIVVSTVSSAVFDAMNAGAVDFVTKPDIRIRSSMDTFLSDMIKKVKIASNAKVLRSMNDTSNQIIRSGERTAYSMNLIAIGASTGGTEAIYSVLKHLSPDIPGIVMVQHIPPNFSRMFAERLDSTTLLEVKEAKTGDMTERGRVLLAPGDKHMTIKKIGDQYRVDITDDDKVNGHRPSVDVLFESVAKEAGKNAVGIILTGMGYDGAKGLLSMRRKGARTIGQDEKTCVVYGMPKVAFNIGAVEKQAPLENIAKIMLSMLT